MPVPSKACALPRCRFMAPGPFPCASHMNSGVSVVDSAGAVPCRCCDLYVSICCRMIGWGTSARGICKVRCWFFLLQEGTIHRPTLGWGIKCSVDGPPLSLMVPDFNVLHVRAIHSSSCGVACATPLLPLVAPRAPQATSPTARGTSRRRR